MDIIWHGHACFTLKGDRATVVTDAYNGLGTTLPKLKADILSLGDELGIKNGEVAPVDGDPKVLDWPGEFEVAGVSIESFPTDTNEGLIFMFYIDGIRVCHLSSLAHEISDELVERIGDIDVLLLPVGGGDVLDGKAAQKVLEALEPRVVIPMYHAAADSKLNIDLPTEFLKAMGKTELDPVDKYVAKGRSALPEETMEVVLLNPIC